MPAPGRTARLWGGQNDAVIMADDDPSFLGVAALRARLAAAELSSAELIDALLGRIDRLDTGPDGLHAVLEINPDAVPEARVADAERAAGRVRGRLHGIPVLVKDNIDTAAPLHTTAGSLALAGDHAGGDAPLVRSLRSAGAIVLGKANLTEWANYRSTHATSGWSALGGLVANPHDRARSAGGSSSGSGAALGAGLAPLTIGTETDGSISCPASLNGVVGLKPTVGLIPRTGIIPLSYSQDTAGPMARSVRDAAELLTVLAGRDEADAMTGRPGRPDPLDYASYCTGGRLDGVRIGVPVDSTLFGFHGATDDALLRAVDVLRDLGAEIVETVTLPGLQLLGKAEQVVLDHELKAGIAPYLAGRRGDGPRTLAELIDFNAAHADQELRWFGQEAFLRAEQTSGLDAAEYRTARDTCVRAATDEGIDAALRADDLQALAMPCYSPAWVSDLVLGDRHVGGCSTLPAVAGYPLISVPCGTVPGPSAPLPVGLALTAGAWSEPVLLRIAAAYEAAAAGGFDGSICPRPR